MAERGAGQPASGGAAGRAASAAARPYTWGPLIALAATQGLETGERQALSQAVQGIRNSFGVSDAAIGWLPTAAVIIGVLAAIPMGMATDRTRRTYLVAGATLVWTAGVLTAGLATSFAMLLGARVLLGALEAGAPPSVSLLSDYYPVRERAKVMGLYQGGALLGGLSGLILGGVLVGAIGWRAPFFFLAPLGVLVAFFVTRSPEPGRGDRDAEAGAERAREHLPASPAAASIGPEGESDEETDEEPGGEEVAAPSPSWTVATSVVAEAEGAHAPEEATSGSAARPVAGDVGMRDALRQLRHVRTFWLGLVAIGVAQLLLTALQFWGVVYFRRVHGLEPAQAGLIASLLGAGAAVGVLGGGPLADRLVRRGVAAGRVYVVALGAIGGTLVLAPAFASNALLVTTPLFVLGGIFLTLPIAPAEALLADVVDARLRGRSSSIRSIVRGLSQTGPLIVGFLSAQFGLQQALVVFSPVYAFGGLMVLLAARTYERDHAAVLRASHERHHG